jgi:tRNA nucleotidyltransferase (CCA-adding enzyme)
MTTNLKTITPDTLLPDIESLMVTYDVGRLPVLDQDNLVGIVTRTDVLRQLHQEKALSERPHQSEDNLTYCPMPQTIQRRLRQALVVELWEILMAAAEAAEQQGWHLYVVGGAVRDILLTASDDPPLLEDVDLVVDGFHRAAQAGAGVELAKVLQERYPESRLQVHGRFQTAALIWHKHPVLGSLMIDIATARTEFYPYPAANPEVEASSIRQDLYRRDFTVNAMAIRLTQPRQGELLDFFGGLIDLQHQQIRVLHTNSFIEDPTRIYRAVRFAVRLGFTIEPQTERYIRHAIDSGIYRQIQTQLDKAPALQTRLKNELKYILQASYWKPAIRLLADLGALQCIHSSLTFEHTALEDSPLWWHLRLMDRWLRRFDPDCALNHWEMLLEVLMAHIEPGDRVQVATNLQLPQDGIERLAQLEDCVTSFTDTLPTLSCASQKAAVLRSHSRETLILVGIFVPRSVRRIIWRYLTHWSQVKPVLDGSDLKQLGYKPGPQFKTMLDDLQAATLDQQVQTAAEAEAYLADHYPLADKKSDQPQKLSSNQ